MNTTSSVSLEELKKSLQEKVNEIRKKLAGKKDFNELPETLRQELRLLYTEAARMAKDVSKRVVEEKQLEEYSSYAKFFTSKVNCIGTVIHCG